MNPRIRIEPAVASGAHRGLLLDKFLTVKSAGGGDSHAPALGAIALAGSAPVYKLAYERWLEIAKGMTCAVRVKGRIRGRLAIGLGNESITEIGCTMHRTYGVPVIPGSSVKGVLRAAMDRTKTDDAKAWGERADFLFGSAGSQGFATVHDGWWIPESGRSGLALDVITGHHSDYYTGGDPVRAPTDFDSPVPNHFLTVTGQFFFLIEAPNESWREFLDKLVRETLTERGVGAKRSAGYGRFEQWAGVE